jgi:hypothetical protein
MTWNKRLDNLEQMLTTNEIIFWTDETIVYNRSEQIKKLYHKEQKFSINGTNVGIMWNKKIWSLIFVTNGIAICIRINCYLHKKKNMYKNNNTTLKSTIQIQQKVNMVSVDIS